MYLIFDTETTGKADFKASPIAEHQPHIVQIGAILMDQDFRVRAGINMIVLPDRYTIPTEASDIHGITTEVALKYGQPKNHVFSSFCRLVDKAQTFVAHNFQFDHIMVQSFANRCGSCDDAFSHMDDSRFCTMKGMMYECNIPNPYGYREPKWPTLQEAHTHVFGKPFDGAHDAMADVRACAALFVWLKQKQEAKVKSTTPTQTITKEEQPCLPSNPPKNPSA